MAFATTNNHTSGRLQCRFPSGPEVVSERFVQSVTTGDLALNNFGWIGILPAGCVPVGVRVDGSDIDSGAGAAVFDVGILDAAETAFSVAAADGGGTWGTTGSAVATAFDKDLTRTLNNMANVAKSAVDRKIGIKVATAPSTAVAGTLGLTLMYRSGD
jgi:hypothetical protein